MIPCLFLINFNYILSLQSQVFWSVIITSALAFKEKPGWIHVNSLSLTVASLSFLRYVIIFTLKWISLLSCLETLSLICSSLFLSPKSSIEDFAYWSDMMMVESLVVSA